MLLMSDSKLSVSVGVGAAATIAISVELLRSNDDGSLIVPMTMTTTTKRLLTLSAELVEVACTRSHRSRCRDDATQSHLINPMSTNANEEQAH